MIKLFKKWFGVIEKKPDIENKPKNFTVRFAKDGVYDDSHKIVFETYQNEDIKPIPTSSITLFYDNNEIFKGSYGDLVRIIKNNDSKSKIDMVSYNDYLWLFVDKNGQEMATNLRPVKTYDYIMRNTKEGSQLRKDWLNLLETNTRSNRFYTNIWYNDVEEDFEGFWYDGTMLVLKDTINLPKGFIKFLTGKEISYEDEPIRFQ